MRNVVRLISLAAAAFVLVLDTAPAQAQEWSRYSAFEDFFGVDFPGTPSIRERAYTTALGIDLPAHVYSAEDDIGKYSVTVVDWRDSEEIYQAFLAGCQDCDEAMPNDIRGAALHAAFGFIKRGSEATHLARSTVDEVRGVRIRLLNEDGSRTVAVSYWHENHLYVVESIAPSGIPPENFVDSIAFIDQDGRRIQYESRYAPLFPIPPHSQ